MISRFTAIFEPADGSAPQRLITHNYDILLSEPERSMDIPVDEREYAQRMWGEVVPSGNALVRVSWEVQRLFLSVAQGEQYCRDLEELLCRSAGGTLLLHEAYHGMTPTRSTRWRCCCTAFSAGLVQDRDVPKVVRRDMLQGSAAMRLSMEFALFDPERVNSI